ncbi:EAL domain-containing protein [Chroococcidiopsis sp. FACHB-1243]|uniref:bifunctional diguanylate cyclase/phosphodiesterase n=1 Tax=Chroococcidiopsis sp. [FACHB-1243] TaxID=2692781 RepID=UPI00177F8E8F|nr:EAL domain-containing protein [Chroococcidiopsis sp. [FACHB-1243]]MBD2308123.1 EAL domain-containing protein [Chroococcidiopsis sp. [FACHB-1243]]
MKSKKTLFPIGVAFTSLIGVLYATVSVILFNNLQQAEERQTRQAVEGVLSAFTQSQKDLSIHIDDWARWNDTYNFVLDRNQDYIDSNLYPAGLLALKLNLVLYVQPSGKIVYGTGFDLNTQKYKSISPAIKPHLVPQSPLVYHTTIESGAVGIVNLPEGLILVGAQPILPSKDKEPIRGSLIFGRYLNAGTIATLSKSTRLPLSVRAIDRPDLPADFQAMRNLLSPTNKILVRPIGKNTIAGYALLPDIYGKPAAILRVDIAREIYHQGRTSWYYLTILLAIVAMIFATIIFQLIEKLVASERKWQESEEYRHLVAKASQSIFLVNASTKQIIEANATFENFLGYQSGQLIQLTLFDLVAENQAVVERFILALQVERYFTGEQQYRRQDGILVDVEINANLITRNGKDVFCIIVHDITKRKQIEQQLQHEAFHDSLTGLANRALFMMRLEQALRLQQQQTDYSFAVLFLDLDRFKAINDSLGHMLGDRLLIGIAQRLRAQIRTGDTLARLGGDEFAMVLENCSDPTEMIKRIQLALKLPFRLDGNEIFATTSIGAIANTREYRQPEDLLRDADTAMYRAKAGGKARYEVFDTSMRDRVVALFQLETDLRRAINNQELHLHYQPIVSLVNQKIVGFEALVRWQHPQRGAISPAEFIPIAEETGLIIPIGWWVLQQACQQMQLWQAQFALNVPFKISVNFSAPQFTQPQVGKQIIQILQATGLDAKSLQLELTESVLMEHPEAIAALMKELNALGVSLALDDFGTGYSSLSYLQRFPINILKLDRSFVCRIGKCYQSWEIVRATIMLARALDMEVVAEGIETLEQLARLRGLKCKFGQGYFFSQPVDSTAAGELLAQQFDRLVEVVSRKS